MHYKKYGPDIFLEPFIETYYIWEDATNVDALILESPPSAYCAMVFNLGDEYKAGIYGENLLVTSEIFFAGQATKSYTLKLKGKISMIGVVFRATSLFHFFRESMDQFVNKRVDAGDFLGDSVIELHKRLSKEVDNQTKIQLVDEYFNLMIESKKIERDRFDASVDYIDEKLGNISLQEVMDEYGFSSRYYQKLFIKRVGVSPKSYLRLRRMSRICHLLSTQKEIDWQDIVFEGGYFDQSHFIKDFLDFIGRNPSVYFKDNKELARLLR